MLTRLTRTRHEELKLLFPSRHLPRHEQRPLALSYVRENLNRKAGKRNCFLKYKRVRTARLQRRTKLILDYFFFGGKFKLLVTYLCAHKQVVKYEEVIEDPLVCERQWRGRRQR